MKTLNPDILNCFICYKMHFPPLWREWRKQSGLGPVVWGKTRAPRLPGGEGRELRGVWLVDTVGAGEDPSLGPGSQVAGGFS